MIPPVVPPLEIVYIDPASIDPNPWNPNRQSEVVAKATSESLQHFGYVEPVVLRPHPSIEGRFEIVNGEHRWKESVALGLESIPAVVRDLTDEQAKKLTIVLNETTGDADVALLSKLLNDLQATYEEDEFRLALPYSDNELEHLLALAQLDWDEFVRQPQEIEQVSFDSEALVELVLLYSPAQREQLDVWLKMIAKGERTDGVSETVYAAIRIAALAANQDPAVPDPV